jgi:predicted N-acetyltransferase YhbS
MTFTIRLEEEKDYFHVENLTREAFWDLYQPGCDEHLALHQLRNSQAFIPELDYVACEDDEILGNIVYSKAVVRNEKEMFSVLCMGPLCVIPSRQKTGIGSQLLKYTIEKAKGMGYAAIVIFGNPAYYHRFGFKDAKEYNIQTSEGQNLDAFMVLSLDEEKLQKINGRFFEDPAFQVDKENLKEFEQNFPFKEKHKREGQFR